MSDIETFLAEVEGRANRATPSPWAIERDELPEEFCESLGYPSTIGPLRFVEFAAEDSPQVEADALFLSNARDDVPRLLQIVREMRAEKQAVIDGMTRAITAEGKANEAFYAMQAERDKLESEYIRCLREALDGWEYAAQYKGEFLAAKHGDASDIAALRKLLKGSDNGTTETK